MVKTIFKISIRNILKHRVHSGINMFGLALGFTAFILIGLFVQFELNWDKWNANYNRIYRVQRHFANSIYAMDGNEVSPHTRAITGQLLEAQFPEFEKISVIYENGGKFLASNPSKQVYEEDGICADSCFFDVFTYHFLEGNPTGLDEPLTVLLSKTMASKLFAGRSAMGQTITLDKKFSLRVTGVYDDLPENSSLRPTYIVSFSSLKQLEGITRNDIAAYNCATYALLKSSVDYKLLEGKIQNLFAGYKGIENEQLQLCPMKDLYFNSNGHGDYIVVILLYGLIGLFILLMSIFNYINLTIANASVRCKEIAVKKINGSSRFALVVQFLSETMLIAIVALGFAFVLVKLSLPTFSSVVDKHIVFSLQNNWSFVVMSVLIALFVGLLSGIYPALFLSSRKIVNLLKGNLFRSYERFNLKKVLVTFQFAISIFLIIITLLLSFQIKHLSTKDLGFKKDNMLYARMSVSRPGVSFDQLRDRILQHPEILGASMSKHIPFVSFGGGMTNWEGGNPDEKINCRFNRVGYDFVSNLGITMAAGRDFSREFPGDIGNACLINEVAAKCFGWDYPIGKRLDDNKLTVIGVMKNYIFKDMHNGTEPVVLTLAPDDTFGLWTFAFRIDPNKRQQAITVLNQELGETFPNDPFEVRDLSYTFNNENAFKIYNAVNRTIIFFTVFNIFLAMIGLLGLVSFTVARRTKEIGIRKINGSNSLSIFYLLSSEYFALLLLSLVVAIPSAWLFYESIPGANKAQQSPWVYGISVLILLTIILLTASYQTIKAATRNPVEVLKYE